MKKRCTDGERISRAHGATYTPGRWDRAGNLNQMGASLLADALIEVHYQVRGIIEDPKKPGEFSVIFR